MKAIYTMKYKMYVDMVEGYTEQEFNYVMNVVNQKMIVFMIARSEKRESNFEEVGLKERKEITTFSGSKTVISVGRSPHGHKKAMDQFFVEKKPKMVEVEVRTMETPEQLQEKDFMVMVDEYTAAQPVLPQKIKQVSERVLKIK